MECRKRIDNTGYAIVPEDEMILVFGGLTARNRTFNNNQSNIYDYCEEYTSIMKNTSAVLDDYIKSCGEELLNDMWVYSTTFKNWRYIKLDYNRDN